MTHEGEGTRALTSLLRPRLGPLVPEPSPEPGLVDSAVLVPLLDGPHGPSLLFTRRSDHLPDHAGQVAFPGGVKDPDDRDLVGTALRESAEEVGVDPERVELIGTLGSITTLAKYRIQPFLSVWPAREYRPVSRDEVERVFLVPVHWLADPANHSRAKVEVPGKRLDVPAWLWEGEIIWGATRRITEDLLERLVAASNREGL